MNSTKSTSKNTPPTDALQVANAKDYDLSKFSLKAKMKLLLLSLFGFFTFFISFKFTADGPETILVEHCANVLKYIVNVGGKFELVPWVCIVMMIAGAIQPFYNKTWKRSTTDLVFSIFKIIGVPVGLAFMFKLGPEFLFEKGKMLDFLFVKLVLSLSFLIPVGGALIIFLTDYGLMEFIGIFARPFMRPVYKTPGRSAVDAVASFVGSYSIGLLITGQQYKNGFYTKKEAAIIATGFSTVSATFCIIVAKTLGLMEYWDVFFWGALVVTFAVTAVTVQIYPLKGQPDEYCPGVTPDIEPVIKGAVLTRALYSGFEVAERSTPIFKNLWRSFKVGVSVTIGLIPSILSVGLLGLLLAEFTPLFKILGYGFYPFTALFRFPEAKLVADALSMGIAEMFLPAAPIAAFESVIVRYVVGVTCISQILFFSACIPCIVSMGIPISIKHMLVIWYERVVLTILICTPVAMLLFNVLKIAG